MQKYTVKLYKLTYIRKKNIYHQQKSIQLDAWISEPRLTEKLLEENLGYSHGRKKLVTFIDLTHIGSLASLRTMKKEYSRYPAITKGKKHVEPTQSSPSKVDLFMYCTPPNTTTFKISSMSKSNVNVTCEIEYTEPNIVV